MKIKTNLSSAELQKVAKGLMKAAELQQPNEIELENQAERDLISRSEDLFQMMMASLTAELERIKE